MINNEKIQEIALTEYDLYLHNQGNHYKIYEKLGAHLAEKGGISGTYFAVWAPSAKSVRVAGNFNSWCGSLHRMKLIGYSGVWEAFIPGITEGELYKYEIETYDGRKFLKADPYAFYSELRPNTASIVYSLNKYKWNDEAWIKSRPENKPKTSPISIYEVHFGSWSSSSSDSHIPLTYCELAERLIPYVKEMGYTHIEVLPLAEHPYDGSWGYQVTGYYSLTSRYGKPEDFMYFVDRCHQEGIGVIADWVPAHFTKDAHGLGRFDGTALYEHEDPRLGEHPQWGTYVFNHGRNEVRNFLVANALFWFDIYHLDGLRVDAVSSMLYLNYARNPGEWVPNKYGGSENLESIDFIRQFNYAVNEYFPGVYTIAEEATSWPKITGSSKDGGLGFTFKWNMGWMNDFLKYSLLNPYDRKYNQKLITFSMLYNYSENFILPLSHDEVVHGKYSMLNKMPGSYNEKFAGLKACYGFMYGHPGKKLLFMGDDFGQFIEWDHDKSLDWHLLNYEMHNKLHQFVKDLNTLYIESSALHELDYEQDGFKWIDCDNSETRILSFIRKSSIKNDFLIIICNFSNEAQTNYPVGVPLNGKYIEIINSDWEKYGGINLNKPLIYKTDKLPANKYSCSIRLNIPALSVIILKPHN